MPELQPPQLDIKTSDDTDDAYLTELLEDVTAGAALGIPP